MELRTERLRLTLPVAADLDDYFAMVSNARIGEFTGGAITTREDAWRKLLAHRGSWALFGYGYAMVRTHAGAFVGVVGLTHFHRELDVECAAWPETGWVLTESMHGQGFATEAMRGLLAWADAAHLTSTWCIINPRNVISMHLARKLGYAVQCTTSYHGELVHVLMRVPQP